jgi:hypothetical protein
VNFKKWLEKSRVAGRGNVFQRRLGDPLIRLVDLAGPAGIFARKDTFGIEAAGRCLL